MIVAKQVVAAVVVVAAAVVGSGQMLANDQWRQNVEQRHGTLG